MDAWVPVLRAAGVKAADARSVDLGLPFETLMEAAGRSVALTAHGLNGARSGRALVVAGSGANGGDGLVA
ncbi:MAG TPA: hypothetical protein VHN99_02695, partial [Deinococcales bacterium]|nr:hypothetical protein [Deinococcales bacterium]